MFVLMWMKMMRGDSRKISPLSYFYAGNVEYHTDLKFEYIEPYVIPKASFTGDPTERVDTRVFQVIYSYDPKEDAILSWPRG